MTRETRRPTGKAAWPITLVTGPQKTGKTHIAAEASASPLIDRAFWFTCGENAPDDFLGIDTPEGHGAPRFEIVDTDGTYRDLYAAMQDMSRVPMDLERPHLWVLDSGSKLWALLTDMAQEQANHRWAKRDANKHKELPLDGVTIGMDLWTTAKNRWGGIVDLMRAHQGPSIITARMDYVNVVNAKGDPTGEKTWKVKVEGSLPFEVDAIAEVPELGDVYLTGVRSSRFKGDRKARTPMPGFTMHDLWTKLGLSDPANIGARLHVTSTGAESQARDDQLLARRRGLLEQLKELAAQARITSAQINQKWVSDFGHPITETTDLGSLELFIDDFRGRFVTHPKGNVA